MGNENQHGIDFYKYLNCPDCKEVGLYCKIHRIEVENILNQELKKTYA